MSCFSGKLRDTTATTDPACNLLILCTVGPLLERTPRRVNGFGRFWMAKIESVSRKPESQVGRSVGAHSSRMKLRPDGERVLPARARSFRLSFAMKLDFLRQIG